MGVFRLQVFKNFTSNPSRFWTNVYHVEAADITAAVTVVPIIEGTERAFTQSTVFFSRVLVSTQVEGDSLFQEVPINANGAASAEDSLPLFNTVRVDIQKDTFGRPDRKYYRLPVGESKQVNGVLDAGYASSIETLINTMISSAETNSTPLIGFPGGSWVSASVNLAVQMRQEHRKRRRAA